MLPSKKAKEVRLQKRPQTFFSLCGCLGFLLFGLFPTTGLAQAQTEKPAKHASAGSIIDAHAHLHPRVWRFTIQVMDRNGLDIVVNLSGGSSEQRMRVNQQITELSKGRIVHFFTPSYRNIDDPNWGLQQAENLRLAVQKYGYRGLKISKALGLGVRWESGVLVPIDDPTFFPLWEMAGRLGVPVAIHTADPRAFWEPLTPENERYDELAEHPSWSYYKRHQSGDVPSWLELLAAMEELVRLFPETPFIGVHFGNAPERLDLVEHMLETYPNFYVDLAARLGEIGRHAPTRVRKLFLRYQDRILFGTDIGINPYGLMLGAPGPVPAKPHDIKPFYDLHWRWLETNDAPMPHPVPIQGNWSISGLGLPESVLKKIYRTNALHLLRLHGAKPRK